MIPENDLEFLHAVWTRRTLFTFIFLGVNIAVFILMSLAGGTTNEATLMAFGVKSNAQINEGETWRLVTPVFIHIGLLHLFFNSYALWIVGPQVEKLYGSARFVVIYLVTGTAGVLGSYFYQPQAISAGASGAIFGLFGVLLAFGIRHRHSIPPFFKKAVGTGVLPIIVINLIIGFTIPGIDNSAHISGLVAGAILGAILPFQRPGEETSSFFTSLQIASLGIVAICFIQVGIHYNGPRPALRNLAGGFTQILGTGSSIQKFIDTVNDAQKAFESSARLIESGSTDGLQEVRAGVATSIDQLQSIPSVAARPDELTAELRLVMQDQYELIQDVERAGTVTLAHSRRLRQNADRYEQVMATFLKWVESDGPKYGIQMGKRR